MNASLLEEVAGLRDGAAQAAAELSDARFKNKALEERLTSVLQNAEASYQERLLLAIKVGPLLCFASCALLLFAGFFLCALANCWVPLCALLLSAGSFSVRCGTPQS